MPDRPLDPFISHSSADEAITSTAIDAAVPVAARVVPTGRLDTTPGAVLDGIHTVPAQNEYFNPN